MIGQGGNPVQPAARGAPGPVLALIGTTLAGWMMVALQPWLLTKLGILDIGMWFMDTHAVLAGSDAHLAGLDPNAPNPLDVLGRPHSYSDWWFALGWLGLDRGQNFVVGLSWVAAFFAGALWALRPRGWAHAMLGTVLLLSPVVLLAVHRGNNDLVVFALLALAGGVLRAPERWRCAAAGVLIGIATGLKFYPAAAVSVFLLLPERREMWRTLAVAVAVTGAVLWSVWGSVGRGLFAIPLDVHKVGAGILLADLGLTAPAWKIVAAVVILGAGLGLAARGWVRWRAPDDAAHLRERAWFTLASAVLVGCFLVGVGHAYRWIFILLLPAWLFVSSGASAPGRTGRRILWILVLGLAWGDGLFCLAMNLWVMPQSPPAVDTWIKNWRLITQPFHWLLMALLSGWLWQLVPFPPVTKGSVGRPAET